MTNLFIDGVNGVQGYPLSIQPPKKGYALAFFFGVFL